MGWVGEGTLLVGGTGASWAVRVSRSYNYNCSAVRTARAAARLAAKRAPVSLLYELPLSAVYPFEPVVPKFLPLWCGLDQFLLAQFRCQPRAVVCVRVQMTCGARRGVEW